MAAGLALLYVLASRATALVVTYPLFLRLARLLRHTKSWPQFKAIGTTFTTILPAMVTLLVMQFTITYLFAVLGVQLFGSRVTLDTSSRDYAILANSLFAQRDYWDFNFNDMWSATTTLFFFLWGSW